MDKEIYKELKKMIINLNYSKTREFYDSRCFKCYNSLSGVCVNHIKEKNNMIKELKIISNKNNQVKKGRIIMTPSPTDNSLILKIHKNILDSDSSDNLEKYNYIDNCDNINVINNSTDQYSKNYLNYDKNINDSCLNDRSNINVFTKHNHQYDVNNNIYNKNNYENNILNNNGLDMEFSFDDVFYDV